MDVAREEFNVYNKAPKRRPASQEIGAGINIDRSARGRTFSDCVRTRKRPDGADCPGIRSGAGRADGEAARSTASESAGTWKRRKYRFERSTNSFEAIAVIRGRRAGKRIRGAHGDGPEQESARQAESRDLFEASFVRARRATRADGI